MSDPLNALMQILEKTTLAQKLPSLAEEASNQALGIGFLSAGYHFLLPLKQISEIIKETTITSIPGAQAEIAGIFNLRGNFVSVIDLAVLLGSPKALDKHQSYPTFTFECEGIMSAVRVDDILEIIHFSPDRIEPLNCKTPQIETFASGSYVCKKKNWFVFSVEKIMRHPTLLNLMSSV